MILDAQHLNECQPVCLPQNPLFRRFVDLFLEDLDKSAIPGPNQSNQTEVKI
jgi:hypothetical protein